MSGFGDNAGLLRTRHRMHGTVGTDSWSGVVSALVQAREENT